MSMRKPEDADGGGEPAGPPPDIFDNLAALRLKADAGALVGAVEVLAHVPRRKPSQTEWVRVHPDADMTLATSFYVDRENRETYLVVPEMREVLITGVKVMLLVTAVNSRGSVFLGRSRLEMTPAARTLGMRRPETGRCAPSRRGPRSPLT